MTIDAAQVGIEQVAQESRAPRARVLTRRELFRKRGISAQKLLAASVATALGGAGMGIWTDSSFAVALGFAACGLLALGGVVQGVRALAAPGEQSLPARHAVLIFLFPVISGLVMAFVGVMVSYFATVGFARGRQIRRRGKILLPKVVKGSAWAPDFQTAIARPDDSAAIAKAWRENGRTEHASVAAFAQLTLDLLGLGAPPALVVAAQQDALDEIAHTEICFSLARALDGEEGSPGPFPEAHHRPTHFKSRPWELARLAVSSLVDGALHEGLSAAVVAKMAKRCAVPEIRAALARIAADEGRHAAHGWEVVQWCLAEGGVSVGHALEGAALALPEFIQSTRPAAAMRGSWEAWGIHGSALEEEEYGKARRRLLARLDSLLKARTLAAA